jgi:hypothetical protein
MKNRVVALALVDLLVTVAVAVLLVSVAVPSVSRVRELSKRALCSVNLSGIGAAVKVYATSNNGSWMVPPFKRAKIDNGGIDYVLDQPVPRVPATDPGEVGYQRRFSTTSETPPLPFTGSEAMSVTRSYWMLVRSRDVTVKQFTCPSAPTDVPDPTENIDLYYDFTGYFNISYGYQVPFGPPDTHAREGMDTRQIVAADKGPLYPKTPSAVIPDWDHAGANGGPINLEDLPKNWRPFNSPNHGGQANGEGENVLYSDGHVSFVRIPASGVDNDNIYTVIANEWSILPYNVIHGKTPHQGAGPPYPGQNALGTGAGFYSATDSLIYP